VHKTFRRAETNAVYWDRRWTEADHDADSFTDMDIYPIKYAEMVLTDPEERALELGCGLGRVVLHYHRRGYRIVGVERSAVAVERMLSVYPGVDVRVGDATSLPFEDGLFDVVMAFGLYHNLENDMHAALAETARSLRQGGRFCITMRPDNLEMRANERYWAWRNRKRAGARNFHKWLVGRDEFAALLAEFGLTSTEVHYARNMSILYRVPFLRDRRAAGADEAVRRAGGYRLNTVGRFVDGLLMRYFPAHFCNVLVFIGTKETGSGDVRRPSSGAATAT